jgi:hypothetical protein
MARRLSFYAAATTMAIAVVGGLAPITVGTAAAAAAVPRTATVVGSLQSARQTGRPTARPPG